MRGKVAEIETDSSTEGKAQNGRGCVDGAADGFPKSHPVLPTMPPPGDPRGLWITGPEKWPHNVYYVNCAPNLLIHKATQY